MGKRRRRPPRLSWDASEREAAANIRKATRDAKGTRDFSKVREAFHDFLMAGLDEQKP